MTVQGSFQATNIANDAPEGFNWTVLPPLEGSAGAYPGGEPADVLGQHRLGARGGVGGVPQLLHERRQPRVDRLRRRADPVLGRCAGRSEDARRRRDRVGPDPRVGRGPDGTAVPEGDAVHASGRTRSPHRPSSSTSETRSASTSCASSCPTAGPKSTADRNPEGAGRAHHAPPRAPSEERSSSVSVIEDRVAGVLAGAAVGDALGGATEGWTPEQIEERHGGRVTGIVGPFLPDWRTARPIAPYHKGDGHVTDDTLMTHALIEVYAARRTPPRRLPCRQRPGAAHDRLAALDSRARAGGADPAAGLPRREVDRRAAALRPRRSARGRSRQHRELRRHDVHGARRSGEHGRPGGGLRGGDRSGGRPPVVLRARGGGRLRGRGRRGRGAGRDGRRRHGGRGRCRARRHGSGDRSGPRRRRRVPRRGRVGRSARARPGHPRRGRTLTTRSGTSTVRWRWMPGCRRGRSRSRSFPSPSDSCSPTTAMRERRSWMPSTTGGTPTRSRRWPEPSAVVSEGARRCRRSGCRM